MSQSYAYHYKNEFSVSKDYVNIRGEDNLFSYTKIKNMVLRLCGNESLKDVLGVILGANIANIDLSISYDEQDISMIERIVQSIGAKVLFLKENKENFIKSIKEYERVRYLAKPDVNDEIYKEAAKLAKIIIREKPLLNGRFELLNYFNEKALSISFHRYGNLGIRAIS
ncbi:hypothetical protein Y864_05710 [Campylobacter jejuni CVM 41908]|nr:hypothetical protein Y864_05710 [Campylobacter jejuni CVM 41908]